MIAGNKKLYVVSVEYQAYVLAEDEKDAERFAQDVQNEEPTVFAIEVSDDPPNPLRWYDSCLVYHQEMNQYDVTLREVLP